jgi:hypothetical protein
MKENSKGQRLDVIHIRLRDLIAREKLFIARHLVSRPSVI